MDRRPAGHERASRTARRYHWLSEGLQSFVEAPHDAIDGAHQGEIVNLTDRRADASRRTQLELLASLGPDGLARELAAHRGETAEAACADPVQLDPAASRHAGASRRARERRVRAAPACDLRRGRGPRSGGLRRIAAVPGVGARTVRALAMVAEVVHGAPYRFTDPARFSFAHGGKDRHPFPVPLKVYDETIPVMKTAVAEGEARTGRQARRAQAPRRRGPPGRATRGRPAVPDVIAEERRLSHSYGGRSVFGWEPAPDTFPDEGKPKRISNRG